jgi:hypothetical protein
MDFPDGRLPDRTVTNIAAIYANQRVNWTCRAAAISRWPHCSGTRQPSVIERKEAVARSGIAGALLAILSYRLRQNADILHKIENHSRNKIF